MMQPASFQPPRRLLLGPGPSDVPERVLSAMARPTIGHLDPEFIRMMDETQAMLRLAFRTKNEVTLVVSGPGSAGMECCFANLLEPGDKAVVLQNGVFGGRMKENVERCGGTCVLVEEEWGRPCDPEKLRKALKDHPDARIVAFVHAETSTGARSDAAGLCGIAREASCLTIVDCVTSLGGIAVEVDAWGADAVYSGSQKCLSCAPGLSPLTFNARAMERVRARKRKVQSWFLDLSLVTAYWGGASKRVYHHTAPVNALYGQHEALVLLLEEGLENAWKRHRENHLLLRKELENLSMEFLVEERWRLPQLNAVRVPPGVGEAVLRARLLQQHGIEIGAGLGPLAGKIWRIGLMGHSSRPEKVKKLTSALASLLRR